MSEHVKYPSNILTVIIRDDSPMYNYNDPPSYRSVRIKLTDEQIKQLALRMIGRCAQTPIFEEISQCFIETHTEETKSDD